MRTIEQQVEAALEATKPDATCLLWQHEVRQAMLDLLSGKFAEEPLPEIVKPTWPHRTLHACRQPTNGTYRVYAETHHPNGQQWSTLVGPAMPTERECIEAWNAGMRPEREVG